MMIADVPWNHGNTVHGMWWDDPTPDAEGDEILDEDLEIVSMAGRILGSIQGRAEAAIAVFNRSYRNGLHDELVLAGVCVDHNDEQPAATATPFVACKAPSADRLNWFCCREIGHPDDEHGCVFAPVEKIPASADDEGDDGAVCAIGDCWDPACAWGVCAKHQDAPGDTDPAQARLDERDTDDSCPYCRSGPAGHVCTTAHGLLAHAAEAPQENRCAYCSEVIVRFADTGVWRHQIVPASTLLDHPATPANLADDAAQGGGPF